jgi:hypothetical protein
MFRHLDDSGLELKYALFRRSGNLLLFEQKVPKHRSAEKSRIRCQHSEIQTHGFQFSFMLNKMELMASQL